MFFFQSLKMTLHTLFPSNLLNSGIWIRVFLALSFFNLISLTFISFPSTTILIYNFTVALRGWLARILYFFINKTSFFVFTPFIAPWYLLFFLCFIEIVRARVRPLTLCFRLIANIRAGHILLSLRVKLPYCLWTLRALFGLLELVVCLVQGYVFTLLLKVYTEEYL